MDHEKDEYNGANSKNAIYEKSKLYAAMMQKDLSVITQAITTFGIQLLPALDAIVQRLSNLLFLTGNYTCHGVNDENHNTTLGICLSCSKV